MIRVTGNDRIDTATAEIVLVLREGYALRLTEQGYYDEAMRLRDEIMAGERARIHARLAERWPGTAARAIDELIGESPEGTE